MATNSRSLPSPVCTSAMSMWKSPDRVGSEALLGGLVALDLGQAADPVPLQAPMQGRAS
jgi:hypothetical protein